MIAQWHAEGGKHDANDERLRLFIERAHESGGLRAPGGGQECDSFRVGFRGLLDTETETGWGPLTSWMVG